ncbi:dienelactone hydrolase family protein [Pseudoluteimonas lycopersici]|uniref:Dienelactone hydrolase family protein n=1 Tax=Pseudoluteimonas lycopersici TaxID=1324796 RepID=A0A516V4I3_9GAMM|nr:dienelactone hydrolase family protein [Lysobacter lycopersici]QDQ73445.1 dienelactone hydrolase family protein [Lysobacter lycopersici]
MRRIIFAIGLLFATAPVFAKMQAKPVEWTLDGKAFSGFLVYDDATSAKRPGVLMVPDWKGVSDNAVAKAEHVAGRDYVVLLADVYGKGVRPKTDDEAMAQVKGLYADRNVLRARANKALEVLRAQAANAPIDLREIGAVGYCFGGATALELARSGADLAAVVTFHGALDTTKPAARGNFKPSLLVLNGADDSYVAKDVPAFQKEMTDAGVDWQFVNFSGAVHCFALPEAHNPPGCVYNELAMRRGERMMKVFFAERFGYALAKKK